MSLAANKANSVMALLVHVMVGQDTEGARAGMDSATALERHLLDILVLPEYLIMYGSSAIENLLGLNPRAGTTVFVQNADASEEMVRRTVTMP